MARNRRTLRRWTAAVLGAGAAALGLPFVQSASAVVPTFDRTLVGPSIANMYPSGFEWDTGLDRLVIADTAGDRVLVYTDTGTKLSEFGEHGTGPGQFASPRDAAVDDSSNIYIADAENHRIQKFNSTGVFQWERGGTGTCNECLNTPIGVTWDSVNDVLLVASSGQNLVKAFNDAGAWVWQSPPVASTDLHGPRDASRGPDGRIWVTDYIDHQVRAFTVTGAGVWTTPSVFTLGVDAPGLDGPGEFNFPYNVDWSPDGLTMYVSDTGNGRISRWNVGGASPVFVDHVGMRCAEHPQPCADPPTDMGQFNHLRRVAVDDAGNIYGADFWGNGIEVFTPAGVPLRSIEGAEPPLPGVAEAYGVDVAPDGTIYVMDRNNHRIERFTAAGTFVNAAGARGTQPGVFSWPEALAVAPDGQVWVADTRNDRIQRWPADLATVPNIPSWGGMGTGTGQFNYIEDLAVAPDGRVFIADTHNNRIQIFDPTTSTFSVVISGLGSGDGQLNDPRGVDVSASAIYVADTLNNRIQKFSLAGVYQAQFGGLTAPEGVTVAPDGTVWVADTGANRILHLSADLVDLGDTFGTAGTGNTQFNLPHTLALDSDELFVADTYNDRVQVFDVGPPADTTAPNGTVTNPAPNASVLQPVNFTGTATDNVGVTAVEIAIRDNVTQQWLQPGGTWGPAAYVATTLASPGATSTGWSFTFTTPYARSYSFQVRARDAANNENLFQPLVNFTTRLVANDTTPPTGAMTFPAPGATVASPVVFTGNANDAGGVAGVDIAIRDSTTGQWLRANGTWGAFAWLPTTVATPGATSTTWSFTFSTSNQRTYGVQARARDAAANAASIRTFVNFTVATADATPPSGVHIAPAPNASVASPVNINGTATDNVGVTVVELALRNTVTGQYLQPNGTWGAFAWVPTTLGTPGGTSTTYSLTFNAPQPQAWGLQVRARDAANNTMQFRSFMTFTTTAGGGGLNPTYVSQISAAGGVAPLYPAGGTTDGAGNRYIADSGGSRLVKIDAANVQTVFSATGWNDPRDIERIPDGTFWVADTSDSQIVHIDANGAVLATFGGAGTFNQPYGLAADASGLWVADTYKDYDATANIGRVVRLDPANGSVLWQQTTCNAVVFSRPRDVALGSDGNVYVADTDNHRIVSLNPATGACIAWFGTQGDGNNNFRSPRSLTSDGAGGLWIADAFNYRLKHVTNAGGFLAATNGGYGTGNDQYRSAHCVFLDGAFVDVCDTFNYRIQRYSVAGAVPTFSSIIGGTQPTAGGFNGPFGVAYGPDGALYVADWFNHRIQKFAADGSFVTQFGGYGTQPGSLIFPRAVTLNTAGTELVVTDSENNRIDVFTTAGTFLRSIRPLTGQTFFRPHQTALAADGSYWIADTNNGRIVHLDGTGNVLHSWNVTGANRSPQGIALDSTGAIYVSNTNQNKVEKYNATGQLQATVVLAGSAVGRVTRPAGLAIAGTGANERLWVADSGNHRVGVFSLAGVHVVTFGAQGSGNGQFSTPKSVAIDPGDGDIAVADHANNRISRWTD